MSRGPEMAANIASLRALMDRAGLDHLVISDHYNVTWLAGGGRAYVSPCFDQGAGRAVITPKEVILLTSNVEAGRMQAEEFSELPWRVVVFPWWEGLPNGLRELLPSGAKVGVDSHIPWQGETIGIGQEIVRLRVRLSPRAQERARILGRTVGQVMSQVCRELQAGESEYEIAGRILGALYARGIDAPVVMAAADERMYRWRHFIPTDLRVDKYIGVAVSGRRDGLTVSCTRLVHFGDPPEGLVRRVEAVACIDAELIAATRPGVLSGDLFEVARAAYADAGFPEEWRNHHQGGVAAYRPREWFAVPGGTEMIEAGQLIGWNPSVPGAKSEDTILVGVDRNEIITMDDDFPTIEIPTGRGVIRRPTILVR